MNDANGKATIREVVDKLDPIKRDIVEIKTLLSVHLKNYDTYCEQNNAEHKNIINSLQSKISTKAFIAWLSATLTIITIVLSLLGAFHLL